MRLFLLPCLMATMYCTHAQCHITNPGIIIQDPSETLEHIVPNLPMSPHLGKCVAISPSFVSSRSATIKGASLKVFNIPLEIQPLVVVGPPRNRVDLVFFSDGYLEDEHEKFYEDAARLAQDISGNQTFNTVKPLMNFWAAFSPSKESGIGVGGLPKEWLFASTPFGLYRDGTELRAVYYSKPDVAKAACSSMGDQCDYPILLGNDPYYGGLGGEFSVVTSSFANGPLVLRHELGHSIINVGEEYDGGFAYFGPNAAHDLSQPIPWAHWLTHPPEPEASLRVERSVMPMQQYPWTLLNVTTPWSVTFTTSGAYSRNIVRFSLSGLPEGSDLKVELDGIDLDWAPEENIGFDRWHYDIHRHSGLGPGQHEVKFILLNGRREGIAQLCSVELLEFGDEDEFVSAPGYYGVFPTFSERNETSFRPTSEDCLMRTVTSPNFCNVCVEGLWLSLLSRVNLVDDVQEGCEWHVGTGLASEGTWLKTIETQLLSLAQFRSDPTETKRAESYTIIWLKDGKVLTGFTNKTRIEINDQEAIGKYTAKVKFATEEVRVDKANILSSEVNYRVTEKCGD